MTTESTKQTIKGITLHRPWGYAVAYLGKRVENRTYRCPLPIGSYLAIHNGKKWDEVGAAFVRLMNESELIDNPTDETDLPGHIIAIAKFVGNVTECDSEWFQPHNVGWLLEDVVAIAPVECKGQQGLWDLSEEVRTQVRVNYREAIDLIKREGW